MAPDPLDDELRSMMITYVDDAVTHLATTRPRQLRGAPLSAAARESLRRTVIHADVDPHDVVANPYGARRLLAQSRSAPPLRHVAGSPTKRPRARRGRLGTLIAASVAACVLAVAALPGNEPGNNQAVAPGSSRTTEKAYPALVLKAAEANPRLLIDEPGWKATDVYGFAEEEGTINFANGGRELEMNWYPADQYDDFRTDRLDVSKPEAVQVADSPAEVFQYSPTDFAAMLEPRGASFVELRTAGSWTRADFDQVLGHIVRADVRTWLESLPDHVVTPENAQDQAAKVLADIPRPPGFDSTALDDLGTNDRYQFGVQVTSLVGCGWIAEWNRAKKAGDEAAVQRAADALRGSRKWKILHELQTEGDWSEVFWATADSVVNNETGSDKSALGCE